MNKITLKDYNVISVDDRPLYKVNLKYAKVIYAELLKLVDEGGIEYALEVLQVMSENGLKNKLMPVKDRGRKLVCPKCNRKFYDLHRKEVPCPNKECDVVLTSQEQ